MMTLHVCKKTKHHVVFKFRNSTPWCAKFAHLCYQCTAFFKKMFHTLQSRLGYLEYLGVRTCPSATNVAIFYNFSTVPSTTLPLISTQFDMTRKVKTISKASVKMVQCPDNNPCKNFYTARFGAGSCSLLGDRNAFWSPLFAETEPRFVCPITSVTYTIRNATIDLTRFIRLFNALDPKVFVSAVWKNRVQAYDENREEFMCVDVKIRHVVPNV